MSDEDQRKFSFDFQMQMHQVFDVEFKRHASQIAKTNQATLEQLRRNIQEPLAEVNNTFLRVNSALLSQIAAQVKLSKTAVNDVFKVLNSANIKKHRKVGGVKTVYVPSGSHGDSFHEVRREMPPLRAQKLLHFLLPKNLRESLIGDLEEEYRTVIFPKFGGRYARAWYWKQVATSILPLIWSALVKALKLAWMGRLASWLLNKLST